MDTWTPIGGLRENPGVWDTGNGALIFVSRGPRGVIRRITRVYARGRGPDGVTYTAGAAVGDHGGAWPPAGVAEYDTAKEAARHVPSWRAVLGADPGARQALAEAGTALLYGREGD